MEPGKTQEQILETLGILQEECAEVIVEVSKIRRFGIDSVHYKTHMTHKKMFESEVGDVLAMVDILIQQGILDIRSLEEAKSAKKQKLKQWSNIYETQSK
jgi:NTP pyrophosphatase (non-canonical NTP hydrolase)